MDIDATFLPVAQGVGGLRVPTQITYFQNTGTSYDPSTGDVTQNITEYKIPAGVLSRARAEDGGVGESCELRLWLHHGAAVCLLCPLRLTPSNTTEQPGR